MAKNDNPDDLKSEEEIQNEKMAEVRAQKDLDVVRAYKNVFKGEGGPRVLHDLMKSCSFNKSTYSGDAMQMAHNEGRRSVVLDILYILEKNEASILEFLNKSNERDKEYDL